MSEVKNKKKNNKKVKKNVDVINNENNELEKDDIINLDDEIVIGLKRLPDPRVKKKSKNENVKKENVKKSKENFEEENTKTESKIHSTLQEFKRKIIKKISIFIFLLFLLIGGIIALMLSPIFNIKGVEVRNNGLFTKEQIILMSDIPMNENIFKFSKNKVKNNLLSNSYIENVVIKTDVFSKKVILEVEEREATFMLEVGNSYAFINNQGYILEITEAKLDVPVLQGYKTELENIKPGNRLNEEDLKRLGVVLKILEVASNNGIGSLITAVNINNMNGFDIILETEDKIVHLGDCSDLSNKMLYVKEMLQREQGIEGEFFLNMDLNKGKPFFREKV